MAGSHPAKVVATIPNDFMSNICARVVWDLTHSWNVLMI